MADPPKEIAVGWIIIIRTFRRRNLWLLIQWIRIFIIIKRMFRFFSASSSVNSVAGWNLACSITLNGCNFPSHDAQISQNPNVSETKFLFSWHARIEEAYDISYTSLFSLELPQNGWRRPDFLGVQIAPVCVIITKIKRYFLSRFIITMFKTRVFKSKNIPRRPIFSPRRPKFYSLCPQNRLPRSPCVLIETTLYRLFCIIPHSSDLQTWHFFWLSNILSKAIASCT